MIRLKWPQRIIWTYGIMSSDHKNGKPAEVCQEVGGVGGDTDPAVDFHFGDWAIL